MTETDILDTQVAEFDYSNSTAETTMWTYTVAGNTLGTNKALRVHISMDGLNNTATTRFFTIKIKYAGVILYNDSTAAFPIDANRRPVTIDFILFAKNSASIQGLGGLIAVGNTAGATTGIGDLTTPEMLGYDPFVGIDGSTDSTASQALIVTAQNSAAAGSTSLSLKRIYAITELLAP